MKKLRLIPMVLAGLLLAQPISFAVGKNFSNNFEDAKYEKDPVIVDERVGTRAWTVITDPDDPTNHISMIRYYGKSDNLSEQRLPSNLGTVTGRFEIGFKVKFSANCTTNQVMQFRYKTWQSSDGAEKEVLPWSVHINGIQDSGGATVPEHKFTPNTWYEFRAVLNLSEESYSAYRLALNDPNAEWEELTPEGGCPLRDAAKYDYDGRGIKAPLFSASGNLPPAEGTEEHYIWCDDFFCGPYEAAAAPIAVTPADGTENVNVDEVTPTLTFGAEMNAATLNESTITLQTAEGVAVPYQFTYEKGERVFEGGGYTLTNGTYTIAPTQPLDYETEYVLAVTDGAKTVYGESAEACTYRFTTEKPKFKAVSAQFTDNADGSVTCVCTVDNPTETDEACLFIMAGYDTNDAMISGSYLRQTVAKGTRGTTVTLTMAKGAQAFARTNVYIWNNFTDYAPKTASFSRK